MRKIIHILVCAVLIFSLGISVCFAEDTVALEEITESAPETLVDEPSVESGSTDEAESETPTETLRMLFQRIYEYVTDHKTELLGLLGDALIFIMALLLKNRVSFIKKTATETNNSQGSVVDRVNDMIDGYAALKDTYDKYGATEDDRNRVVGALVAQNTAILEILTTVYVNSKNLPQGVKDLVNLKYANCLKQLDNDEQLKAIVTAVRENIGTNMIAAAEDENSSAEV